MTASEPSLAEKVVAIDQSLSGARVPHAFGGALALAYYAEPRATIDIDINVFVAPAECDRVSRALGPLGVDPGDGITTVPRDGQARWWWGRTPVDLFFSYDPIHDAMRDAVRRVPFGDDQVPILGPEHLAVCKAAFDRPKDWIDIEQMLAVADGFDSAEALGWLERMFGAQDPRTTRFAALAEAAR